jgi:hypothetical protein
VVSLAAGLAGGNGFGTILLRALVSVLVAGALGLGAQYLLRRFLPELGPAAEAKPAVDILIDEEVPLAAEPNGEAASPGGEPEPDLAAELEAGLEPGEAEPLPEAGPFAGAEGGTDFEPPAEAAASPEDAEEGLEPLEAEMELPSGEGDGLEVLPDGGSGGGTARRPARAEELEAQLDSVTKGQDPASLAKAVRSFLRKDQEG